MNDSNEQDLWEDDKVEIVDLAAPDKGFRRLFFSLEKRASVAVYPRIKSVVSLFAIIPTLLVVVLLPGSSLINNQNVSIPIPTPTSSYSGSEYYIEGCTSIVIINVTPDQTGSGQTNPPPTFFSSGDTTVCSSPVPVTVLPVPQNNRNHNP